MVLQPQPCEDPGYATEEFVEQAILANGSSGRELAYAERIASGQTTNTTEVDVTDCSITFEVTDRPVHVFGHIGLPYNSVAGQNTNAYITDENNVKSPGALDLWNATGSANQIGTAMKLHERIDTPGTYTRKLRFSSSSATASSAGIMGGGANMGKAYILAVEM